MKIRDKKLKNKYMFQGRNALNTSVIARDPTLEYSPRVKDIGLGLTTGCAELEKLGAALNTQK